jgi:hypothetical protein
MDAGSVRLRTIKRSALICRKPGAIERKVIMEFQPELGEIALSIGAVAAGVSLKRTGSSWVPVVLLGLSSFGIAVFRTHAWPGGPLTFGGIALAAAWLQWEKSSHKKAQTAQLQFP